MDMVNKQCPLRTKHLGMWCPDGKRYLFSTHRPHARITLGTALTGRIIISLPQVQEWLRLQTFSTRSIVPYERLIWVHLNRKDGSERTFVSSYPYPKSKSDSGYQPFPRRSSWGREFFSHLLLPPVKICIRTRVFSLLKCTITARSFFYYLLLPEWSTEREERRVSVERKSIYDTIDRGERPQVASYLFERMYLWSWFVYLSLPSLVCIHNMYFIISNYYCLSLLNGSWCSNRNRHNSSHSTSNSTHSSTLI